MVFAKDIKSKNTLTVYGFVQAYLRSRRFRVAGKSHKKQLILYRDMLSRDPISRFCVEIISLYMFSIMGEYKHDKATITKDIRNSIANCAGSWEQTIKGFATCFWYGFSFSEIASEDTEFNRKKLKEIRTIDPSKFEFEFDDSGEIKSLILDDGKETSIPYETGIHLVYGSELDFDYVNGSGRCECVYPYWEFFELIVPVLAVAAQRQSTGILVKKTETEENVVLINPDTGQPELDENGEQIEVSKGWDSLQQLMALDNSSVTVIDRDDDLYSVSIAVDGEFLLDLVKLTESYRFLGFLVPSTIATYSISGVGDSNLSKTHLESFLMIILGMVQYLNHEIIEKLFRPFIDYNFGVQKSYGEFQIILKEDNLFELLKEMLEAIKTGRTDLTDPEIINKYRNLLGLEPYEDTNNG